MFYTDYIGAHALLLRSVSRPRLHWVVTEEWQIRADEPSNGNERFEIVDLGLGWNALRAPTNNSAPGSGSVFGPSDGTRTADATDCFVGFSEAGVVACYSSREFTETRIYIIPHL